MNLEKVGNFIAELRKEKGLTQEKLGEQLGVSGKTISKWERGVNAPDIALLNSLSTILGVDIKEILNGERKAEKNLSKKRKKLIIKIIIVITNTNNVIPSSFSLLLYIFVFIFPPCFNAKKTDYIEILYNPSFWLIIILYLIFLLIEIIDF